MTCQLHCGNQPCPTPYQCALSRSLTQRNGGECVDTGDPPQELKQEDFAFCWLDLFGACAVVAVLFGLCGYFSN